MRDARFVPAWPPAPRCLALCRHLLGESSVHAFLAEHRRAVFSDELFADLFPSGRRPSVPADVIATVMVLQALEGLSDRQAVRRLEAVGRAGARHHRVAVHVQERASLDHNSHRHQPLRRRPFDSAGPDGGLVTKSLRCVLVATGRSARDPRVKLTTGSERHRKHDVCPADTLDSHPTRAAPPGAMTANEASLGPPRATSLRAT